MKEAMKNIINNPYRVLGVLAGATAKDLARQTNILKRYLEAEQTPPQDDDSFPVLGTLIRTKETIEEAASKLNLDADKINAAMFWFWNGNPITDEVAFDALRDGEVDKAYEIWDKMVVHLDDDNSRYWNEVSAKNLFCFS